jgi:hypothetical protein
VLRGQSMHGLAWVILVYPRQSSSCSKIGLQPLGLIRGYLIGSTRNLGRIEEVIALSERHRFGGRRRGACLPKSCRLNVRNNCRLAGPHPIESQLSLFATEIGASPTDWRDAIGSGGGCSHRPTGPSAAKGGYDRGDFVYPLTVRLVSLVLAIAGGVQECSLEPGALF